MKSSPIRTAIFGGSFNPIHNGHIRLAHQVITEGHADEVWLLVSPQNPLKQHQSLQPEAIRLELTRRALAADPQLIASDFEFTLPRPSYTWNTLCALREAYPDRQFSLLIGADNWALFDRWAHPDDILSNFPLLVYPRPGYPLSPEALPPSVHLIQAPLFPYSSTDVRQAVQSGAAITEMVPECIREEVMRVYGKDV